MTVQISAKFKVANIVEGAGYKADRVLLVPDYADGRNKDWAAATPAGTISLDIGQDTEARKHFEPGRAFTILMEPNDE